MSESSFDKLYKLIEYVLFNEEVNAEEILKTLIDINTMLVRLDSWCLSKTQEEVYSSICDKSFKLIDSVVDTILKYLILKHLEGKVKLGNDVISRLLTVILDMVNAIKIIIENSMLVQEERILCKVLKPISIDDKVVEKGYIITLPIDMAIMLFVSGYVKPIYTQASALLRS